MRTSETHEPKPAGLRLVESRIDAVTLETRSCCDRRLSPERRCLNPSHRSVSDSRSSNRTCSFPASELYRHVIALRLMPDVDMTAQDKEEVVLS